MMRIQKAICLLFLSLCIVGTALAGEDKRPKINLAVKNYVTGEEIKRGTTLTERIYFQVVVTTNDVDCAGQYVVTALGDANLGAPPSVLVNLTGFIIGPSSPSGESIFTGPTVLDSTIINDWKISATCNGVKKNMHSSAFFEFFVDVE